MDAALPFACPSSSFRRSYRQWVLSRFGASHGLWEEELDAMDRMLQIDHYNNSAWNQRAFVLGKTEELPLSLALLVREVDYALG